MVAKELEKSNDRIMVVTVLDLQITCDAFIYDIFRQGLGL